MNTIVCSASPVGKAFESVKKRIDDRRTIVESSRAMNLKRLQHDVQRIAKKETEFVKKLVEEIVPVRVSWKPDAWEELEKYIPFRIEPLYEEKSVVLSEDEEPTSSTTSS